MRTRIGWFTTCVVCSSVKRISESRAFSVRFFLSSLWLNDHKIRLCTYKARTIWYWTIATASMELNLLKINLKLIWSVDCGLNLFSNVAIMTVCCVNHWKIQWDLECSPFYSEFKKGYATPLNRSIARFGEIQQLKWMWIINMFRVTFSTLSKWNRQSIPIKLNHSILFILIQPIDTGAQIEYIRLQQQYTKRI